MRTRARLGGLVAAAGAATLVVPLLAMAPAQAAAPADLFITKTVRAVSETTIAVPDGFDPTWGDTRATGGYELVGSGLRVWTGPNNPGFTNKAAEYVDTNTPLDALAAGGDPSLSYSPLPTGNTNNQQPGFQLVVDLDGNGSADGILVGEPVNAGKWWLGRYKGQATLAPAIVAAAPHPAGGGGPSQGSWGTLSEWDTKFAAANVVAFGFSLGSNSGENNGVISAINFNGQAYTFGGWSSSIQAAPGSTVEYKLTIGNTGGTEANGVAVNDTLPADLTYVDDSLGGNAGWCGFNANKLTCTGGQFPANSSTTISFRATVSDTITSTGLPATIGHNVDVQKQEVFADLPSGQTKTYSAMCPAGYMATDGGLLIDAVDQGGFYSDIVVNHSKPVTQGAAEGWQVSATNLGDERGQGKVKVTCLGRTVGSANGHTHSIVTVPSTLVSNPLAGPAALDSDASGTTVERSCPSGYTPVAPQHEVLTGVAVIRSSLRVGDSWMWVVDHEAGTSATFDVQCLSPQTSTTDDHSATLTLTTQNDTIPVGPESRAEGIEQCGSNANVITGGYGGFSASVLSLGKEQRGNNEMFRFYNDDWSQAWNAKIQASCVGVRTPDEAKGYHVKNTATVTPTDASPADNTSTADIVIAGDAVAPLGSPMVRTTATTNTNGNGKTTSVVLKITCTSPCSFSVKVLKGGDVVAKGTKSLPASPVAKSVTVATTSLGKDLTAGDHVTVKVKTTKGSYTSPVTLG